MKNEYRFDVVDKDGFVTDVTYDADEAKELAGENGRIFAYVCVPKNEYDRMIKFQENAIKTLTKIDSAMMDYKTTNRNITEAMLATSIKMKKEFGADGVPNVRRNDDD